MASVLVIEDESEIRELLRTNLEVRGLDVAEASDGAEAIDQLLDCKPDLIILDVMMPEIDGFEVLEFVRARTETQHVPVVLVTALDEQADRIKGLALGAQDYVTKPFSIEELMLRIASLIQYRDREAKLINLTITDPATNLYNARYLRIRLPQLLRESHGEVSVLWIRVAGLEKAVDEKGWGTAELIESRVAEFLGRSLGPHEEGFALGGGHFVVTTWKTGQDAERWEQQLTELLKEKVRPLELGTAVSTSTTMSTPKIAESADELIDRLSSGGRTSANQLSSAAMEPQSGKRRSVADIIAERHRQRRQGLG